MGCRIGERELYFDLSQNTHSDHPFRLVYMGNN